MASLLSTYSKRIPYSRWLGVRDALGVGAQQWGHLYQELFQYSIEVWHSSLITIHDTHVSLWFVRLPVFYYRNTYLLTYLRTYLLRYYSQCQSATTSTVVKAPLVRASLIKRRYTTIALYDTDFTCRLPFIYLSIMAYPQSVSWLRYVTTTRR